MTTWVDNFVMGTQTRGILTWTHELVFEMEGLGRVTWTQENEPWTPYADSTCQLVTNYNSLKYCIGKVCIHRWMGAAYAVYGSN